MDSSLIVNKIIQEINPLDIKTKLEIIRRVMSNIRSEKKNKKKATDLTQLKGLGAEIWMHSDVDQYIVNERKWD